MRVKLNKTIIIEIIVVLLITNYLVVTIILGDPFYFKYLRDIILIFLLGYCFITNPILKRVNSIIILILSTLVISLIFGMIKTPTISLVAITIRKYIFPLCIFTIMHNFYVIKTCRNFLIFILHFFSLFSLWGLIQAFLLKDRFLIKIGYPTVFLPAYGENMLGNSFYFGNLGIQRLVSTLSNSNAAATILGMTLILLIYSYPYMKKYKYINCYLVLIVFGYFATVSRANFLAMFIVFFLSMYKYIPYKKKLFLLFVFSCLVIFLAGIIQGNSGIVFKLLTWINNTIQGRETSSAGRLSIWLHALNAVLSHPFGIGFGHVGTIASNAGLFSTYFACESSYLAMALDTGIIGAIFYLFFLIILCENIIKISRQSLQDCLERRVLIACKYIIIYFMIAIAFSNHIYDMEVVSIFYIYIGLAFQVQFKTKRI